jgi:hypothetical protein
VFGQQNWSEAFRELLQGDATFIVRVKSKNQTLKLALRRVEPIVRQKLSQLLLAHEVISV